VPDGGSAMERYVWDAYRYVRYDVKAFVSRSIALQPNIRSHGILPLELLRCMPDWGVSSDERRLVDDSSSVRDGVYSLERAISMKEPLVRSRDVCRG
jgi:hypothetical protein